DAALLLLALIVEAILLLREFLTRAAGTHQHGNFPQFLPAHVLRIERGVPDRFIDGGRGERHCPRYVRAVLQLYIRRLVETVHLAGNARGIAGWIEARYAAHAAAARPRCFPERLPANSVRTDGADASDNHPIVNMHVVYRADHERLRSPP